MRKKLTKLVPCKVKYGYWWYIKYGGYSWTRGIAPIDSIIKIDGDLSEYAKLAVLAHEIGHARCDAKNCKCFQINRKGNTASNSLCEYHANQFALKWLLKNRCKKALRWETDLIKEQLQRKESSIHKTAANRLIKLVLWKKCMKYLK